MRSVDLAALDLELREGLIDFGPAELIAVSHQRVTKHFRVDLPVHLEGAERLQDDVIVVGAARHLLREERDQLREVDGPGRLGQHRTGVRLGNGPADVGEGRHEVRGGNDAVVIHVHDAESLFELLNLLRGEKGENVAAASLRLPK